MTTRIYCANRRIEVPVTVTKGDFGRVLAHHEIAATALSVPHQHASLKFRLSQRHYSEGQVYRLGICAGRSVIYESNLRRQTAISPLEATQ